MTISYPVTLPTSPSPRRISLRQISTVGLSKSPFTGEEQTQVHQGEWWEWDVEYAPIGNATLARALIAALVSLNGLEGTVKVRAYPRTPRGTWAGSPVVNGGVLSAEKSLAIAAASVGATGKAGDWLQVGTELKMVTADFVVGAGGEATLDIWPRWHTPPANAAPVITANPVGLFRVMPPFGWSLDVAMIYGLQLSLREAL